MYLFQWMKNHERISYNLRWQLSTPTLAVVVALWRGFMLWLFYGHTFALAWPDWIDWTGAAMANLVGANIFIYVDRIIFKKNEQAETTIRKRL